MKIRLVVQNVAYDSETDIPDKWDIITVADETTTLQRLFEAAGFEIYDISDYYEFSQSIIWNDSLIPFIFHEGKAIWDVTCDKILVADFLETHQIKDGAIFAKTGYPQAGGPGILAFAELWEEAYPIIEQVVTMLTATGMVIKGAKWFCSLFKKKNKRPQTIFDVVYLKKQWSHHELAEKIDVTPDEAKNTLRLFGYKYNQKKMMYIAQPEAEQIKTKLLDIKSLDI